MSDDDETGIESILEAQEAERAESGEIDVDNEIMTV
jgi:hypothetical protein